MYSRRLTLFLVLAPPTWPDYSQFLPKTQLPTHPGSANQRCEGLKRPQTLGGKSRFSTTAMIYSAGSGTLDGPFLRRIKAEGRTGVHEWHRLDEARVSTALTKRRERFTRLTAKMPPQGTSRPNRPEL